MSIRRSCRRGLLRQPGRALPGRGGDSWDGLLSFTEAERPDRASFRGRIRDIQVSSLRVVDGALPYSVIAGFDREHGVDHVLIEGLQYLGRPLGSAAEAKLVVDHARDVDVRSA